MRYNVYFRKAKTKSTLQAGQVRALRTRLPKRLREVEWKIKEIKAAIIDANWQEELNRKLSAVPGSGPVNGSVLEPRWARCRTFRTAGRWAAWRGLTPERECNECNTVSLGNSTCGVP